MDAWVNVFPMPFLYADSGPWRKMSSAWFSMSVITTSSGTACPSRLEPRFKKQNNEEKNESAPKENQQPPNALKMKTKQNKTKT